MELITTSVGSKRLKSADLLIYGTCAGTEEPEKLKELTAGKIVLTTCLEKVHMDMAGFKLATIMAVSKPKSVTVVTMDGSPHCVQLHLAAEQAKALTAAATRIEHYVFEKGKLCRVSSEAVKAARHLSAIQEMLDKD